MYPDCIALCLSWFLSFIVSIILLHINPDRRYQIIFFCAIKSLVLNMDGTAKFGWGLDWTPWNRELPLAGGGHGIFRCQPFASEQQVEHKRPRQCS